MSLNLGRRIGNRQQRPWMALHVHPYENSSEPSSKKAAAASAERQSEESCGKVCGHVAKMVRTARRRCSDCGEARRVKTRGCSTRPGYKY